MKCNVCKKYNIKNNEKKYGKNADPRLIDIIENMDKMTIGLDDEFEFGCRACGECCTNRTDILLNPKDIYNIAKELGRETKEIIDNYCESYIGGTSRLPVVRLRAVGSDKHCPLLSGGKCSVHKSKPTVCALFPLARAFRVDGDGKVKSDDVTYLLQPSGCNYKKEKHTVRQWLTDFGIPIEDQYHSDWSNLINELSKKLRELEKKLDKEIMSLLYSTVAIRLYYNYDTSHDFESQFKENAVRALEVVNTVYENHKETKDE